MTCELFLVWFQGGGRGRKKRAAEREEREKLDEEKEKPYACEGEWNINYRLDSRTWKIFKTTALQI